LTSDLEVNYHRVRRVSIMDAETKRYIDDKFNQLKRLIQKKGGK